MLKIYDTDKNFILFVDKCRNARVVSDLETGFKTFSFQLPVTDEFLASIAEEYYISTGDAEYVVKELNFDKNNFMSIFCEPNIESLKKLINVFDAFDINIESAFVKALAGTDWTLDYQSALLDRVEYKENNTNAYEMIEQIRHDYELEVFYDTKEKIVHIYDMIGANRGTYFSNELRLKMLKKQGQSYDFCTVLYPIGKNGLTIGDINNGLNIIENYSYCNKYIPKFWIQDDIEYAQQLKMAAEAYLSYVSSPIVSYSLELSSLPSETSLGDNIIIVDKIKRVKQRQRIVKLIHYPFSPEKDTVELSNQIVNFANIFTKYNSDFDKQIEYIKKNLASLS